MSLILTVKKDILYTFLTQILLEQLVYENEKRHTVLLRDLVVHVTVLLREVVCLFLFVCVHDFDLGRGIASTLGGSLLYSGSM
jgi:hypothetical protein